MTRSCSIAIVGGGTAGLALATKLKNLGIDDVLVIEREQSAGGVPRHCGHFPFGVFEFKRLLKGPAYAQALINAAKSAGVEILTDTTVTALHPGGLLSLADQNSLYQLQAERVVLCTGIRESTRAQRFLSGQRPQGILPTGALQSMVYLHSQRPFQRPVILGTELVSFSAIMTCKHLGIRPVAMLEENTSLTAPAYTRPYPFINRIPVHLGVSDIHIEGQQHVEAIRFTDAQGRQQTLATDGIIISGQFRPESALIRNSHLAICTNSGGPSVDQFYRCSDPSYFCTGNLLRPVETSAWCWQEARLTATIIAEDLQTWPVHSSSIRTKILLDHPSLKLVIPQFLTPSNRRHAMPYAQLRLRSPVKGKLLISSSHNTLCTGKLNNVPERRILTSLQPLTDFTNLTRQNETIRITVKEGRQ